MITGIVGMTVIALLFAAFGLMRPADRKAGGCHGCEHGSDGCDATTCGLLKDL
jgi:hypothetical protein